MSNRSTPLLAFLLVVTIGSLVSAERRQIRLRSEANLRRERLEREASPHHGERVAAADSLERTLRSTYPDATVRLANHLEWDDYLILSVPLPDETPRMVEVLEPLRTDGVTLKRLRDAGFQGIAV